LIVTVAAAQRRARLVARHRLAPVLDHARHPERAVDGSASCPFLPRLERHFGWVLVRLPAPRWDAFLALALDEIILYGAGSLQVARRLSALVDDLVASAPAARRPPVSARAARLRRAVRRALPDEEEAAEAMHPDHQGIGSPRETS
jgi:hypothetical protein